MTGKGQEGKAGRREKPYGCQKKEMARRRINTLISAPVNDRS
ncbi:hypothetical protein ATPR_0604 [Acetobacter tropicalis NBRC 101654]|uniref:Uncharacterized protein n=1 Tax=Acetobacter tropicalis NBRC 101654 TaxID=749388 RepID=F7VB55_9PROT|nr:hypothetical protein ATPR_0604 [Acetobacter tropicalis NBRC 101654]